MKKFSYFCVTLVLMLSYACVKEEAVTTTQQPEYIVTDVVAVTSADKALEGLTSMLNDVVPQTRMIGGHIIRQQTLIHVSDIVEAEYRDIPGYNNAFYLVTYEDENGMVSTAFLGATPNLPSVIAIINNIEITEHDCHLTWEYIRDGENFELPETRLNPGSDVPDPIIPPAVPPISSIIGTPQDPNNPIVPGIDDGTEDPSVPMPEIPNNADDEFTVEKKVYYRNVTKIEPLIKSHFHQNWPYNRAYEFINKEEIDKYYAGCVVVALAQTIAYNKLELEEGPNTILGAKIDWPNIKSAIDIQDAEYKNGKSYIDSMSNKYSIAQISALSVFCRKIADEVVTLYRKDGTSSNLREAKQFLKKIGYKNVEKQSFDESAVYNMIVTNRRPLCIGGQRHNNILKGHAWVIDGWYQRDKIEISMIYQDGNLIDSSTTLLGTDKYVHYNWGWTTGQDGYYGLGVFDTMRAYEYTAPQTDSIVIDGNYDSLVKIITYTSAE